MGRPKSKARAARPPRRTGTSADGIEYSVLGAGPRTLLNLPGGPGSELPSGLLARFTEARFLPFVRAGYAVWTVTRPRGMPPGHTVADMASDCARFVEEHVGAPVDLLLGESYGGMIALHVAADHPQTARRGEREEWNRLAMTTTEDDTCRCNVAGSPAYSSLSPYRSR